MALWNLDGSLASTAGMDVPNATHGIHGPIHVKHLIENRGYDESETWCGAYQTGNDSDAPEDVSCVKCLRAAARHAERIQVRLVHLTEAK